VEHSNLQKSEKGNVNLASRTLKFLQIKSEQTDPLLHYSYESMVCSLALPFLLIVLRSPSRESEQGRPSELAVAAGGCSSAAVEWRGMARGVMRTHRATHLGRRRSKAARPRAEAALLMAAPSAEPAGGRQDWERVR